MANKLRTQQVKKNNKKNSQSKIYDIIKKSKEDWQEEPKGEEFSICAKCGQKFEQDYFGQKNRYSSYKTCLPCRIKERSKKEKKATEQAQEKQEGFVGLLDYNLLPWQQKCLDDLDNHQFQVLAVGNRAGKTRYIITVAILLTAKILNENRHIDHRELVPSMHGWIIAPTEKIARQMWREIKKFMPKEWIVAVSDSTLTMQTIGGGVIEVQSAYDPEALVGVGLDWVIITEASRIKDLNIVSVNLEARVSSPNRGLEKDRQGKSYGAGKMIFESTPIGKNDFYTLWCYGQKNHDSYSSKWISYQLPWTVNPANEDLAKTIVTKKYGKITYEEDLRRRYGDRLYKQNFLADFLALDSQIFPQFEENCVENIFTDKQHANKTKKQQEEYIENWKAPKPYHQYRLSWDIATGGGDDEPILGIWDMTDKKLSRLLSLYGKHYDEQYDNIAYWSKLYNNAPCVYSSTGHTAVVGQLTKRGVQEIDAPETGNSFVSKKALYINNLERAVQTSYFKVLFDGSVEIETLVNQIKDYSKLTNGYGNKSEPNDDYVSMTYLQFHDYDITSTEVPYYGYILADDWCNYDDENLQFDN